jgi:prepilin-type N-terminal cleavage/methylation domain-containing protein
MATGRRKQAGFTLTETMVVLVIISILAALSTPLLSRDNTARKGRDWAKIVAQTLQRARFQALGDRTTMHVLFYRTHVDIYRQDTPTPVLLTTTPGPAAAGDKTVAIWAVQKTGPVPSAAALTDPTTPPTFSPSLPDNDIAFSLLGSTTDNSTWSIYIRNELLPAGHPDASFLITVSGLTGYISSNNKVTLP